MAIFEIFDLVLNTFQMIFSKSFAVYHFIDPHSTMLTNSIFHILLLYICLNFLYNFANITKGECLKLTLGWKLAKRLKNDLTLTHQIKQFGIPLSNLFP